MNITDYIETSRFSKGKAFLDSTYQKIYSEMFVDDSYFPTLKTCYTSERTCEFIALENQKFIIYDQYIGQTLNMFNRLFYNSTHKFDSIVYAYKCFAEIFHYMGERKMAALCACAYVLNRESAKSFKNDVDLESRLRTTFLQEKFILLHEIYHWKFSQFSPEKKELLILEKRLEILKYWIYEGELPAKEVATAFLNDAMEALSDDEESEKMESEPYIEVLTERLEENREKENDLMFESIYKRDDLIEEILCDEYALKELVKFEENTPFSEIFCSTYIGIESLQLMTSMRIFVMDEHDNKSQLITDSAIRKMAYRKCTAKNIVKIDFEELHKRTTEINIHFSNMIRDPIMFVATYNLEEISKLEISEDEISNLDELIYNL